MNEYPNYNLHIKNFGSNFTLQGNLDRNLNLVYLDSTVNIYKQKNWIHDKLDLILIGN